MTRSCTCACVFALLIGTALPSSLVHAQQSSSEPARSQPSEVSTQEAIQDERKRAEIAETSGNLTEALSIYEALYAKIRSPAELWWMALLHLRRNEPEKSITRLKEYEERLPPASQPAGRQEEIALVKKLQLDAQRQRAHRADSSPGAMASYGPNHRLRVAKWILGGLGVATMVAGGVLWGIDGRRSCPTAPACAEELDTAKIGIGLLAVGSGLLGSSILMFGLDYEPRRTSQTGMLVASWRM